MKRFIVRPWELPVDPTDIRYELVDTHSKHVLKTTNYEKEAQDICDLLNDD